MILLKFSGKWNNVMCENLNSYVDQALELQKLAQEKDLLFAVYAYTGYSMVRYARELVKAEKLVSAICKCTVYK